MPKVQDLGDQVSAIPSLTYEYLRPNWSDIGDVDTTPGRRRLLQEPRGHRPRQRLPDGRPGDARGRRVRRRQGRDQPAAAGRRSPRSRTRSSARAPGSTSDQTPATFDPDKAKQILEDGGWTDSDGDGIREKNGLEGQDRAVHDDPPGPPGHARAGRRRGSRTSASTRSSTRSTRLDLRRLQRVHRRHAVRPVARQLRPRRARDHARRSTRWATTSATTAASSTRSA